MLGSSQYLYNPNLNVNQYDILAKLIILMSCVILFHYVIHFNFLYENVKFVIILYTISFFLEENMNKSLTCFYHEYLFYLLFTFE